MQPPVSFAGEALTGSDLASLRDLAHVLWPSRHAIAQEWSRRIVETLPDYFPPGSPAAERLTEVNDRFLALVLQQAEAGDLQGLYDLYYRNTRELIEADLQRAPARRISLLGMYTSARVSLRVIGEYLDADYPRRMLAYTKLTAQLMMLVGQAYCDAREEYLQKAFEQINTVSHELRAPLSNLFGYLEMLRAGDFGPVSPEQGRVLGELVHETDDLLWLLTSTLNLSPGPGARRRILVARGAERGRQCHAARWRRRHVVRASRAAGVAHRPCEGEAGHRQSAAQRGALRRRQPSGGDHGATASRRRRHKRA
jgi:hypothetical protein